MPTRRRFSPCPLPGVGYTAFAMRSIAASLETVTAYIGMLGMDFTVESPADLVPHPRHQAEVYLRAAGAS